MKDEIERQIYFLNKEWDYLDSHIEFDSKHLIRKQQIEDKIRELKNALSTL